MLGIDPGGYSLRQLYWMIDGRNKHAWDQTDLLAVLIHNSTPKKTYAARGDFNPYRRAHEQKRKRDFIPVPASVVGSFFPRSA